MTNKKLEVSEQSHNMLAENNGPIMLIEDTGFILKSQKIEMMYFKV
jgi:hypothetical protein